MENLKSNESIFSIRIVSIDYYMSPPIPDMDICYSSFQGGKVNEVPVIRIFGSTPAGQKSCLHVHRVLPYLYVPCSDISLQTSEEGDAYTRMLSRAIENALKLKGGTGLKRQHVHGCTLVRARKFYGFHSQEELFVKIFLYYPHEVSRVAALLLGGAVLDRGFQPHESHIPYILQFLVDNNLYGMGHLHVSKVKFRHPLPDNVFARAVHHKGQLSTSTEKLTRVSADSQADSSVDASLASPIWISSTISKGWIWHIPTEHDASQDLDFYLVKRLSTCDLEGDAIVDEILNQQLKMYSSLSQTRPEVKMVQSLVPIWEEEYERTRKREESLSSDLSSKPSPYFVLKTLLHGNEIEYAHLDLCGDAIISSFQNTPLSEAEKFVQSVRSLTDVGNMIEFGEHVNTKHPSEELLESSLEQNEKETVLSDGSLAKQNVDSRALECEHELSQLKPDDKEMLKSGKTEASTSKVTGFVALGLSKWFDSSQVAAVLNTDAETDHNFDISDLLHTPSSDWVSEKANLNYDCQSQQECQDILDSVDNLIACENVTPQVDDGSHGDKHKGHVGASSQVDKGLALTSERKGRKRLRESLPLSSHDNADDVIESASLESKALPRKKVNTLFVDSAANADSSNYGSSEGRKVSLSSMRDLMRRKRHHRVEPSDFQPKRLEFNTSQNDMETVIPTGISLKLRGKDKHTAAYEGISCTESCSSDLFSNVGEVEPERSPVKYVEMTFIKKSPVLECLDEKSNDTSSASAVRGQTFSVNEDKSEGTCNFNSLDVNGRDGDAIPPFFGKEDEVYHNLYDNEDHYIVKDIALGVPIHYQSAGPSFYLLTPVLSPPSVDSVHKWLSPFARKTITGITDTSRESIDSEFLKPPSSKESKCLGPLNKDNGSLNIVKKSSDSVHRIDPFPDASSQENKEILKKETYLWDSKISSKSDSKGSKLKGKERIKKWQDISQFPFPEEKSKLTPLSQKGFRDPASVGNGQQLTLLSMEIQAESRGDLRPNPRIDAINVIALVIQEDNDHVHESYLLLHGSNGELYPSGISGCKVVVVSEESHLFEHFVNIIHSFDPDILMGWEIQGGSLGYLAERAAHLGTDLLNNISRTPSETKVPTRKTTFKSEKHDNLPTGPIVLEDAIIEDEWGRTHASGVHVVGRVVLNIWRLMQGEIKLNMYTIEAVSEEVLRRKVPSIPFKTLTQWFLSGSGCARTRCIEYVFERAKLNLEIMNQLDMINRTSELARVFGIDFFSVLSRGSQYRVESMLLRLAHMQNYIALSPGNQQVASQPAMECIPLVMEPESGFYADPVIVLDFQSLYPSMIIAYNLCFCTCLGKVVPSKAYTLGVSSYLPEPQLLMDLKDQLLLTPSGVMYVPLKVRKGVLPRLLDEILSTRIMVKKAMKKFTPSERVLYRIFNARQLALKLIANVTYGYTAAGFSGRMPCAELADSIVQCGRRTLEKAISFVNSNDKWNAKVIYGDTDSMFVLLKGRTVKESLKIGQEIASEITSMNPSPVMLKMEKVYQPCFLLTKKRYVGYSYESPDQVHPTFDAKGIETVRRDSCGAVAKTLEHSLRLFFEHQEISKVRVYLQRQWARILGGKVSLQDFVFAKEVRLGTYSSRATSLPPAAIVATKAMKADPRAEPRDAERIPYVVIHGEPGARLFDMVINPLELLEIHSPYRLNDLYYINKQIIPALQRVFGLVGADLNQWFLEMPKPIRPTMAKRYSNASNAQKTRIDSFYLSKHCILCGEFVQASTNFCEKCSEKGPVFAAAVIGRTSKLEMDIQHLTAICRHCGGGDWIVESGVKCTSLACKVFYERRKIQKEFQAVSSVATDAGLYPKCMMEWF